MKVALVWNGDANSAFTYGKVKGRFDVSFLLTFLQRECSNAKFLSTVKLQCEKLGVPFFWVKMKTAHPEEYRETIAVLKEDYGIEGLVMPDAQVMIEDACRTTGLEVIKT